MTYFGFLVRFLIVPLCLLAGLSLWDARREKAVPGVRNDPGFWVCLTLLGLLAFVYTTPWDNYLVARGVWEYNPGLVSGVVWGWVPVEEYIFFILETVLTGVWWRWVVHHIPSPSEDFLPSKIVRKTGLAGAGVLWLGSAAILIAGWFQGTYLAMILAWGLPVLAVQAAFGADILWHYRRSLIATVIPVVLYLSTIDALAIQSGTWRINPGTSTGFVLGNLPFEEALFFLVTALMISFGLTLALSPFSKLRWENWSSRFRRWMAPSWPGEDLNPRR